MACVVSVCRTVGKIQPFGLNDHKWIGAIFFASDDAQGPAMTRFFFDVVNGTSSSYDFHGQYFKTESEAREMAEIVSFDLACSENAERKDTSIQVRDALGQTLFSVPVCTAEAA